MISARGVSARIGSRLIIANIDLEIHPGEIAVIAGPNGSGKSTLLKALCGDLAFAGDIALNGRDLRTMRPRDAAVVRAVLPQATTLAFPFTVREVVRLGLLAGRSGVLAGEDTRLPDRALARVDLAGFAGRLYQELSGGEQQRVQLARVLCQVWAPVLEGQPRYLLFDEPVASLDIRHQLLVMEIARDFARRGGGVLAVLHDLNLAARFADRVHIMHKGRIAATGTPREVLTGSLVGQVFECEVSVARVEGTDLPVIVPIAAARSAASA